MPHKRLIAIGVAGLALLAVAWWLYPDLSADSAGSTPAVALPPDAAPRAHVVPTVDAPPDVRFEVSEVDGVVEVDHGAGWVPVQAGERLSANDRIRTGHGAHARLGTDAGDELNLRESVELTMGSLGSTVTELTLTRGKVRAEAAQTSEGLQIAAQGARAHTRAGGRFTIYSDDRGAVTVASERGLVRVLAKNKEVSLRANERTHVAPGGTPSDPVPIPDQVFLRVAWPEGEQVSRRFVVRGKTEPGTRVLVGDVEATVDDHGEFAQPVVLDEGGNLVSVTAERIDGKTHDLSQKIRVNTHGPPLNADPSQLFRSRPDAGP